jgi:hypothetical protein
MGKLYIAVKGFCEALAISSCVISADATGGSNDPLSKAMMNFFFNLISFLYYTTHYLILNKQVIVDVQK